MALDPLTALSLAGNIVQFVDFSIQIVSRTKRLYGSSREALDVYQELDLVTADLKKSCDLIPNALPSSTSENESGGGGDALQHLCATCHKVADELLARLDRLKVSKDSGAKGGRILFQSFHSAMMSVWSKVEIEDLVSRLSSLRNQIQTHVLLDLR
jgi:hypothetical protein